MQASDRPHYDVFLNYAKLDEEFVEELVVQLEQAGARVWFAKRDVQPGAHWPTAINTAIADASKMVAIWSAAYFRPGGEWTRAEAFAKVAPDILAKERPLIPLLIEDCEVDPLFRAINWVDYRRPDDRPLRFRELVQALDLPRSQHERRASNDRPSIAARMAISSKDRLVDDVAAIYSLFGWKVDPGGTKAGKVIDLRIQMRRAGLAAEAAVICLDRQVRESDCYHLLALQNAIAREEPRLQWILIGSRGFSPEARELLTAAHFMLLSYAGLLRELVPLEDYVRHQVAAYEADVGSAWQGDHDRFIRPDVRFDASGPPVSALEALADWLGDPGRRMLLLLGDLGTGKSTLARFFAYQLGQAFLSDPLRHPAPVVIPLLNLRKEVALQSMVIGHMANFGLNAMAFTHFIHLLREQRVVMIFDGFDEMADHLHPEVIELNFQELRRAAWEFNGKVLLTCRTHYFRNRKQLQEVIAASPLSHTRPLFTAREVAILREANALPGIELVALEMFTPEQIRKYLRQVRPDTWEDDWATIGSTHHLDDLARRPLLLELIVQYIDRIKSQQISIATLYVACVGAWLHREESEKLRTVLLDREERFRLSIELAWWLWYEDRESIEYAELVAFLRQTDAIGPIDEMRRDAIARELQTASFLRRDAADRFSFMHSSFRDFFLARRIIAAMPGADLAATLDARRFEGDVIYFLSQDDEHRGALLSALRDLLRGRPSRRAMGNALQLVYQITRHELHMATRISDLERLRALLADRLPDGAQLDSTYLADMDLEGLPLRGANLTKADLSRANLGSARFFDCSLESSNLEDVDAHDMTAESVNLEQANLQRAIFTRASFSNCDFTGANCQAIQFESARLRSVKGLEEEVLDGPVNSVVPVLQLGPTAAINAVAFGDRRALLGAAAADGTLCVYTLKTHELLWSLRRAGSPCTSLSFHPRADLLASGDDEGVVSFWNVATGVLLSQLRAGGGGVSAMAFGPGEVELVTGQLDGVVSTWSRDSQLTRAWKVNRGPIHAVAIDSDGEFVAAATGDGARIWDVRTGRIHRDITAHNGPIRGVAMSRWLSADGALRLATAGDDRCIRVWDVARGQLLREILGHTAKIQSLAFDQSGQWLLSASGDNTVKIWAMSSGELHQTLIGHVGNVRSVGVGAGHYAATGGEDGSLKLWTMPHGRFEHSFDVHRAAFSRICLDVNSGRLAAADETTLWIWDLEGGVVDQALVNNDTPISGLCFAGSRLISRGEKAIHVYARSGKLERTVDLEQGVWSEIAIHPNGETIAGGTGGERLALWNVDSGAPRILGELEGSVRAVAFDASGGRLAAAGTGPGVYLFSTHDGKVERVFRDGSDAIWSVAFDDRGSRVAAGGQEGIVRIWSVATGQLECELNHRATVTTVAFDASGTKLLTAGTDGRVIVWCPKTGEAHQHVLHRGAVQTATFDRSSQYLIAAGAPSCIQISALDRCEAILQIHTFGAGKMLALLPDGRFDGVPEAFVHLRYTERGSLQSHRAEALRKSHHDPAAVKSVLRMLASD